VTSIDITAANAIAEVDDALHAAGIELCFAEMKDGLKDKLKRFGLLTRSATSTSLPLLVRQSAPTSNSIRWNGWTGKIAAEWR
jgi:hypothetical protein